MPILRKLFSLLAAAYDYSTGPWLVKRLYGARIGKLKGSQTCSLPEARSILVVRLDEIGDAVLMVPMLRGLRSSAPHARITLLVKSPLGELFETSPYVDRVREFGAVDIGRGNRLSGLSRLAEYAKRELQGNPPDLVLLPRWDADVRGSAILAYLSGASRVVGYSEHVSVHKSRVNRALDMLLTDPITPPPDVRHEVERGISLLEAAGGKSAGDGLELWLMEDDRVAARQLLPRRPSQWIGLGVSGGGGSLKAWPPERFVELAKRFPDYGFVLVGGPSDMGICGQVAGAMEADDRVVLNAAGQLTLRRTAALLALCDAYVGSDSGPMHLAGAVGIPVVSLFGSSCPHRFRPWTDRGQLIHIDLLCGPCRRIDGGTHDDRCQTCIYDHPVCMHSIDVAQVQGALAQVLPDKII